ncbi:DNA-directed RNA polymerase subunit RPC12/RpoP [Anoxybacillus tengchongensis]|uniref:DNA-directed RNA polymerase subunit RPC12/RpoP n=1 Tax=Anoxybacillus tengchongensis TaxID=576944 RepID=A0A7W9YQC4_9BACL|nr:hypothetical protein [Anoxybacillus tengchongensis]MBB6176397.1 DNA-directed RNA polymerase subunit RPC12/RpoP [Anoxybacillus tengchongensis]
MVMRKHGDKVEVSFNIQLPVNVCSKCRAEFILFYVSSNEVWKQLANGFGILHCPYCGEKVEHVYDAK